MMPPFSSRDSAGLYSAQWPGRKAFTLLELLLVMGVIAILAAAVAIVLPGIVGAKSAAVAAQSISDYMNFARSQAVGQNTYVVTGFNTSQTGQAGQSDSLQLVGFRSLDGSWNINGTNVLFQSISKPVSLQNVQLTAIPSAPVNLINAMTSNAMTSPGLTNHDVSTNSISGSLPSALPLTNSASGTFSTAVLIFTPQGQVLALTNGQTIPTSLSTVPYERYVLIAIKGTHGGVANNNASTQSAAIAIDGDSGAATIYRP